jgi:hypothetical protein
VLVIEQIAGYVAVVLALIVVGILLGSVIAGVGKSYRAPEPDRDLCKRGCGIVHSIICGSGIILEGLPLHCERAYCHRGQHEAGDDMNFRCWPNRDDPEDAVEQSLHGPPFAKMIL